MPPGVPLTAEQRDVVDTIRMIATLPSDSLGAYVISMAQTKSDVLAVVLLQRELGVKKLLRVVPLFETLADLTSAPATMRSLFQADWYLKLIDGAQECMIGYRCASLRRDGRARYHQSRVAAARTLPGGVCPPAF